jgi:pimeloyl-ACP methyl ester carboxylesterase
MKRFLVIVLVFVAAIVVLPPVWYVVFPADPPPDLPPAGRRVELATGVALNVLEEGSGPAVVMIHGLPGSAYDWRALLPELASRGYRAIAYDRVGYGRSDPRPGDDDRLAPVSIGRYLHTKIPNSTLHEIEGGSHMLPVTHAAKMADEIAAF